MPHITAQCLLADATQTGHKHTAGKGKFKENRNNERLNTPGIHLDLRGLSAKSLLAIPDVGSSTSRGSLTPKMSVLPTPTSITSIIFDAPQKPSPSSSVSSANPLEIAKRANTPVAELEDTSLAYLCPELEDTSNHAIRSRGGKSLSSYTVKSMYPTARSLVSAVDQQFADYEAEIRFLRNNIAEAEKSLREARKSLRKTKEAADDSNHALDAAQEAIADRDYEIEIKKNVIAELEKEVKHCQKHHPPPTPPSKWRGSDGAVSRFNADINRSPKSPVYKNTATPLSPSLIGRPFAVSPNTNSEGFSTGSAPKTPRSTFVIPSSGAPSPSAVGSPFPQPHQHNQGPKSSTCAPLTAEALATAFSSAAGTSKFSSEAAEVHSPEIPHVRKGSLEELMEITNKNGSPSAAPKPHNRSRRAVPSSTSTPNLRDAQDTPPWGDAPALPSQFPMMSGGLGIIEGPGNETQEQKLRKKRGALGDLFRRKDSGLVVGDDMVRRKEHGSTIMDDMAHALDYYGI